MPEDWEGLPAAERLAGANPAAPPCDRALQVTAENSGGAFERDRLSRQ